MVALRGAACSPDSDIEVSLVRLGTMLAACAANTAKEPDMEQQDALKQELLALETRYWDAIKAKDSRTAANLSGDPCIVVGAQGVGEVRREAVSKILEAATYELNEFSIGDIHIRQVSDDVVALAYSVTEDLTVDGRKLELKAFDTSVWKKSSEGWTCVIHTESPAGDPFGRH